MIAISLLLLSAYVTSYLGVCWAESNGHARLVGPIVGLFVPLDSYGNSDLPLAVELDTLSFWAEAGGRVRLTEIYPLIKDLHAQARERVRSQESDAPPG